METSLKKRGLFRSLQKKNAIKSKKKKPNASMTRCLKQTCTQFLELRISKASNLKIISRRLCQISSNVKDIKSYDGHAWKSIISYIRCLSNFNDNFQYSYTLTCRGHMPKG